MRRLNNEVGPIVFNPPPSIPQEPAAQVQNVGARPSKDFKHYFNQALVDEVRQAEAVIACLVLEAAGEGRTGMEAVYEVIRNRAKSRKQSMFQVVTAPKQFSCFNNGVDQGIKRAKTSPAFKSKWQEAISIYKSNLTNHTNGAEYYHTLNVHPKWGKTLVSQGYTPVRIGQHLFYTPPVKRMVVKR